MQGRVSNPPYFVTFVISFENWLLGIGRADSQAGMTDPFSFSVGERKIMIHFVVRISRRDKFSCYSRTGHRVWYGVNILRR